MTCDRCEEILADFPTLSDADVGFQRVAVVDGLCARGLRTADHVRAAAAAASGVTRLMSFVVSQGGEKKPDMPPNEPQ
jgi:hypothetical protein